MNTLEMHAEYVVTEAWRTDLPERAFTEEPMPLEAWSHDKHDLHVQLDVEGGCWVVVEPDEPDAWRGCEYLIAAEALAIAEYLSRHRHLSSVYRA